VFSGLNYGPIEKIKNMNFIPTNSKYKKQQKGKKSSHITNNIKFFQLKSGSIGLKALSFGRITTKQLQTLKQQINKQLKKKGRLKMNIFPQTPISKKPLEIRMGKGKGAVDHWVCKIKPGTILLEIDTEFISLAIKALELIQIRISLTTKIVFN